MRQYDTGGLSAPLDSVVQALRGVHPGLFIIRSRFALNADTGQVVKDPKTGAPIERARYWAAIKNRGVESLLFPVQTPEGDYMPCDMRLVRRIGTDLGIATASFEEMIAAEEADAAKKEEARKLSERERFRRFIESNKGAWKSAMDNLKNGVMSRPQRRGSVLYSYDGQPIHSTPGDLPMTAREKGLEVE